MIFLTPRKDFRFPITAECIVPDIFKGKSVAEIGKLEVFEGNKTRMLDALFRIETESDSKETTIQIDGNVRKVRGIGSHMKEGSIVIVGDVGMHTGEAMEGGKIEVSGNVESWMASMMKGGEIRVHGDVAGFLGAPPRGSFEGISGGRIIVDGNVGNEAGAHLKRGLLKVTGNAGQFTGLRMKGGTICVGGDCDGRAGAGMKSGKVVVCGHIESVLPTFTIDGVRNRVKIEDEESIEGPFFLFSGDLVESGEGKLYVRKKPNPHLSCYERFLQ